MFHLIDTYEAQNCNAEGRPCFFLEKGRIDLSSLFSRTKQTQITNTEKCEKMGKLLKKQECMTLFANFSLHVFSGPIVNNSLFPSFLPFVVVVIPQRKFPKEVYTALTAPKRTYLEKVRLEFRIV